MDKEDSIRRGKCQVGELNYIKVMLQIWLGTIIHEMAARSNRVEGKEEKKYEKKRYYMVV